MEDPAEGVGDDAYYKELLARVDDTITETRESGHLENYDLMSFIFNEHSILGICLPDPTDSFSLGKRVYMLSLSLFFALFLGIEIANSHVVPERCWGTDLFLLTVCWQVIMMTMRIVLQRAQFTGALFLWPHASTIVIVFWGLYDICRIATIADNRKIYACLLFMAGSAINYTAECATIAWRYYFFNTCCPCCVRKTSEAGSSVDI